MMPRKILTKNPGPSSVKLFPSSAKQKLKIKQELQEVFKFPIEIFWNLEASLKSKLLYL